MMMILEYIWLSEQRSFETLAEGRTCLRCRWTSAPAECSRHGI